MLEPGTEDYVAFFNADKNRFFAEEGDEPESEFNGSYALLEQTDSYVTYIADGYSYTGGAHPMPWYYGITFSKLDGSVLGYDMFDDNAFDAPEPLIELISNNIREQYLNPMTFSLSPPTNLGLNPTASCFATVLSKSPHTQQECLSARFPSKTCNPT